MNYPINDAGIELLKASESFVGVAYPDPVSPMGRALQRDGLWRAILKGEPIKEKYLNLSPAPWTIGWGFTVGVHQGDTMTLEEGNEKLAYKLVEYVSAVKSACTVEPNENQLAALVVCAWNIGIGGIKGSTILKCHNRDDFAAAARAFALWDKAGKPPKRIEALATRRRNESILYSTEVDGGLMGAPVEETDPMPQTVQGESSLLRSPIIQGTATTATVGIAGLSQIAEQVNTVQNAVGVLGPIAIYWPYIAIGLILVVAGVVIWNRYKQRSGGWA